MSDTTVDEAAAHVHFSKACFNQAWTLIEKADRTAADDEAMIQLNQASLFHWGQRPDCTDRHRAIGYWQASRIRALLGHRDEAIRYATLSLGYSGALSPFYQAYAHEALARAALVGGDAAVAHKHATLARTYLQAVADPEERALLVGDLASLP